MPRAELRGPAGAFCVIHTSLKKSHIPKAEFGRTSRKLNSEFTGKIHTNRIHTTLGDGHGGATG